jgi:outer membrane protein assembly factor BamB
VQFGDPLIADGKVYIGNDSGVVNILELADTRRILAKRDVVQPITASPVFANGTLYILTDSVLYAIAEKP